MNNINNDKFIKTFARGLQVLQTLGDHGPKLRIVDLVTITTLSRSAIDRYLSTLIDLGYVSENNQEFSLTPKVLNLGLHYLYSLPFWRQAQLELEGLAQRIKQSCAMSILDGNEIVYIIRIPTYRIIRSNITLGTRLPANVVSMGRVLLAELSPDQQDKFFETAKLNRLTKNTILDKDKLRNELTKIHAEGYAWVNGEMNEMICGIAIPIKDMKGNTFAAINVSLPSEKFTKEKAIKHFLPELQKTAAILSTLH